VEKEAPLMNTNKHVSDPRRDPGARPAALRARAGIPALAALTVAVLAGGCAAGSPGQPTGAATGLAHAASGTASAGTASAGTPSAGTASAGTAPAGAAPAGAAGCGGGTAAAGGTGSGTAAAPLQAIQFAGDGHGWAAGAGRILATSDGGRTWTRQYAGPAVLNQVDFTGTADGWAVGPGALLRTVNGGERWTALAEPRLSGHCLSVSSVHFVSPVLGYAIAGYTSAGSTSAGSTGGSAAGQLLRTTDGGVSWQQPAGAPAGAQAVCFSTAQDGYLGAPGRIWRTTDAGASWSLAFTEPPVSAGQPASRTAADRPELGCAARDAAWVLFLGSGAAMMHAPYLAYATGDGAGWHGVLEEPMLESAIRPKVHLPAGPGSEPGPFSVISSGAAAFVGYTPPANGWGAAPLILATDGGAVLRSAGDIPAINEPLAAAFLSPSQGWVVGENLKARTFSIEATTDAGRTWTTQYTTS
jgi:photosystem II stability/assembly factor-like uncharacterized protein